MTDLKNANAKQCMTLLKEFIDAIPVAETDGKLNEKKENAVAAYDQLTSILSETSVKLAIDIVDCVAQARGC